MLFYEALFSLLCHFDIVRVEEKSRVVLLSIYMPLHHVRMCMFREIAIWSCRG